jgi:hypothetical protein
MSKHLNIHSGELLREAINTVGAKIKTSVHPRKAAYP